MLDDENVPLHEIVQRNTSRPARDLYNFFGSGDFTREKGSADTNVTNVVYKRCYNIPAESTGVFFDLLNKCRLEARMSHYAERQWYEGVANTGIMIDIDHNQASAAPAITPNHIKMVCRRIGSILSDTLDFAPFADAQGNFVYHMFVIRKPEPALLDGVNPPTYRDGFHILIPELRVSRGYKRFLIAEISTRGVMAAVFNDIPHLDSPAKMIDAGSAHAPVLFFGCSKRDRPAYPLSAVWRFEVDDCKNSNQEEVLLAPVLAGLRPGDAPTPINLCYELSLGHYSMTLGGHPTWLCKREITPRAEIEGRIQTVSEKTGGGIFTADELAQDESDLSIVSINNTQAKYVHGLLNMLSIDYATDYKKWFLVMAVIAQCGTGEDFRVVAREFSRRAPEKYSPAEFDRVWGDVTSGTFRGEPVRLGSLRSWARACSPDVYREYEKNSYGGYLRRQVYLFEGHIGHATTARLCTITCGDKFIVDVNSKLSGRPGYCWYEFVTPGQAMKTGEVYKWRQEYDPDNLHLYIGEHLPKIYQQVLDTLTAHKDSAENKDLLKYWKYVEGCFKTSMFKLQDNNYQRNVIEQAQFMFRRRGFAAQLDNYEYVLGVGNGVLKIGADPTLIQGYHEYAISKFTEVDYVPFDAADPFVVELLDAFRNTFPEPDVFEFMMMHAATGLDMRESACLLVLLVGGGQNGKTFFAKMVHNAIGNDYCATGKPALLTAPAEKPGDANSAQMQQKDKRYFYFDEFNKSEHLNTARVKAIVTPSWQTGRDLYAKQSCFKNTSNPIALSNFDFVIDTTDHGTWRRIYYYICKTKFCAKPNPANPYERLENARLIDECSNDPRYRQAMLSIMVEYYRRLTITYGGDLKRVPVPTIMRESAVFRNRQDAVNLFITQMLVLSPKADPVPMTALTAAYIAWYSRTVRQSSQTALDAAAGFGNSRIAASLERRLNSTQYLIGYRIKGAPEDPLEPGESEMITEEMAHAERAGGVLDPHPDDAEPEIALTDEDLDGLFEGVI